MSCLMRDRPGGSSLVTASRFLKIGWLDGGHELAQDALPYAESSTYSEEQCQLREVIPVQLEAAGRLEPVLPG